MAAYPIDRRTLCLGIASTAALPATAAPALAAGYTTGPGTGPADAKALDQLRRVMKIYASLASGTIWYWYSGTLELAPQNGPILPVAGIETLIRRDVTARADGTFSVRTMEANLICSLADGLPTDRIVNPVNGRIMAPLHFTEGPRDTPWTVASLVPRQMPGIESRIALSSAGDYTFLKRELHADFASALDIAEWPLEASGRHNRTGSFSTHCALTRDVDDPALHSAPCSFTYSAIFGWLPWLLMGQAPGHVLWRANGMKLADLAPLPAPVRSGFDQRFPAIFAGTDFGPEGVDLWQRFKATRKPSPL